MCPHFMLSDNGTDFKTPLVDNVFQQLGIDCIFSAPYQPQSNGKLDIFHKYLKPTLKKLCEKDPDNWDKYINQVLGSYHTTPHLATTETPFFLGYRRDPNLPLNQLLEPMQQFLGDHESGCLDLKSHHLAFVIAKKTLDVDENGFKHAWKTTNCTLHTFKIGERVLLKNKQPGKWDKRWRAGYRIVHIECNGHYIHIENQARWKTRPCNVKDVVNESPVELWSVNTTLYRVWKFINHPGNSPLSP